MPRYRFSWDLVPQPILRRLARDLDLAGEAAEALAQVYGKRPRETFVRDAWPTLRDTWLARDTARRREIVAILRERGLGDPDLPVRNRAQQQAYLASCRNASALRTVVLGAFHALGDPGDGAPAVRRSRPLSPSRGLWPEIAGDWTDFEGVVAAGLEAWTGGPMLVRLPEFHRPDDTWVRPWICVTDEGDGRPGLAIVSGTPFPLPLMVGPEYDAALRGAGWAVEPADADDIECGEAFADEKWCYRASIPTCEDGTLDVRYAARMVVGAANEIFGVLHPLFLEPEGFWADKDTRIQRVENGDRVQVLSPEGEEPAFVADPEDREIAYEIHDVDHLQCLVDAAVAARIGHDPQHDGDGDIPLNINGFATYVRVAPDGVHVSVFCPLLTEVADTSRMMRRLNELNQRYWSVRLDFRDGTVTALIELWCWPFVPALLRAAVDGLSATAHDVDHIHERLGGVRCDEC